MGTPLHKLVKKVAATNPAILISDNLLVDLLTRRLRDGIRNFVGRFQPYPVGTRAVQIGLTSCTYVHGSAGWSTSVLQPPDAQPGVFFFNSTTKFDVTFAVTKMGDPSVGLFEVTLRVLKVSAAGRAAYTALTIGDVAFDANTVVTSDPNAAANANAIGITDVDVTRLQGLVEGSIAPSALRNIFAGVKSIDIRSLFPTVVFNGQAEVAPIAGGLLIIARDGWRLDESQRCLCGASAPDVVLSPGQPVESSDSAGSMPVVVVTPPPRNPPWPVETGIAADVALYLPKAAVDAITSGPYPAVADFADDNGFIGWRFDYTVAFTGVAVTLADPRATIVLSIDFYVSGGGVVNVDVPCIGRQTIGYLNATNRLNGPSRVEIGITPRLQSDGKIILVPEILGLKIQDFQVDCYVAALFLLSYLGPWGTLAAFALNEIIRRVIQHNLPIKMNSALREAMAKQMWTLVDLAKLDINAVFGRTYALQAAVSRLPDSLLVGLHSNQGRVASETEQTAEHGTRARAARRRDLQT